MRPRRHGVRSLVSCVRTDASPTTAAVPSPSPTVDGDDVGAAAAVVDDSFPLGGWDREKDVEGGIGSGLEATDAAVVEDDEDAAAAAAAAAAILALPGTRRSRIPSRRSADDRPLIVLCRAMGRRRECWYRARAVPCLCLPPGIVCLHLHNTLTHNRDVSLPFTRNSTGPRRTSRDADGGYLPLGVLFELQ
jgi:hypothetical protein